MMEALPPLDVLRISTVLEDTLDQLAILGYIMPVSYQGRPDAGIIVGNEIGKILKTQKLLECKYEQLMSSRAEVRQTVHLESKKLAEIGQQVQEIGGELKMANNLFIKNMKQSPLTSDNLKKVQADRQFVADVINEAHTELKTQGTFNSLLRAVGREKEKKADFQNTVAREEEGRKRIKDLQKELQEVQKEKEEEIQNRNEMIAHLKDQLQEMKAKTSMEGKYVKKDAELQVLQVQKKGRRAEVELEDELRKLKEKSDDEMRVHMEIENFLRQLQNELEEKLEYWMEKYDKDTEAKQQELNALKSDKANNLAALQELAKQIQAWWRGTMVRKGLGSFQMPKKGKKEGGKGKKGKGKKGDGKKKKK
ncbi:dynein regulatory complex protein 9 isoform X2 [Pleurodeles waltl]|uniref:dynein regulatory complex protein 9 isoform X2 n=1 Tax=Pleurodeles waltl TaxID=8319 RepID=UPI0037093B2C